MKLLVLNGSPKSERSNTMRMTEAFVEGFSSRREADIDIIDVSKLDIRECRGCFSCWNKTPGKCVIADDMSMVIQKLLQADVVIWSFPLYHYSLPSRLKSLIDRQLPLYLPFMERKESAGGHACRFDMTGKRYVVISTCGFYTAEGNYKAVDAQFDRMYGKGGYTPLYCGQGELFRVPEVKKKTDEYLEAVREAGAEFADGAIAEATKERLKQLIFPREVFEQMADASWGIEQDAKKVKTADPALVFTRQMAALYNKAMWKGQDIVVEFVYTDVEKTYQIVLGEEGHTVRTENFLPYTTRIETPLEVWKRIGSGELDGRQAMMEHLYRVVGDFDIMLNWDEYFGMSSGGKSGTVDGAAPAKKTNMRMMLFPWVVIWVVLSINSFWGGIAGNVVCALLPFAFLIYKPTVFEYISIFSVSLVSLLSVLGLPVGILIPASYFIFGVMWFATVFMKVPLSAWYSLNGYGGEKALQNPLFMQTNRILTACWGILYLVTPVWTCVLLGMSLAPLTGICNSVLPAGMGVFTMWFQRWYPRYYAGKRRG